jgi:hypothetical protein
MTKKKNTDKVNQKLNIPTKQIVPPKILPENAISLIAKNEIIAGSYCNEAFIHHTQREFVLDFVFGLSNQRSLVSRVITSPQHVKMIHKVLGDNIKKYEEKNGEIKI